MLSIQLVKILVIVSISRYTTCHKIGSNDSSDTSKIGIHPGKHVLRRRYTEFYVVNETEMQPGLNKKPRPFLATTETSYAILPATKKPVPTQHTKENPIKNRNKDGVPIFHNDHVHFLSRRSSNNSTNKRSDSINKSSESTETTAIAENTTQITEETYDDELDLHLNLTYIGCDNETEVAPKLKGHSRLYKINTRDGVDGKEAEEVTTESFRDIVKVF